MRSTAYPPVMRSGLYERTGAFLADPHSATSSSHGEALVLLGHAQRWSERLRTFAAMGLPLPRALALVEWAYTVDVGR